MNISKLASIIVGQRLTDRRLFFKGCVDSWVHSVDPTKVLQGGIFLGIIHLHENGSLLRRPPEENGAGAERLLERHWDACEVQPRVRNRIAQAVHELPGRVLFLHGAHVGGDVVIGDLCELALHLMPIVALLTKPG